MLRKFLFTAIVAMVATSAAARPTDLVEPKLHIAGPKGSGARVALTFDACMGKTDMRILKLLVEERIPATLFVTARWLRHNPGTFDILRAHPDLFEIENHGESHIPAVDHPVAIYGIQAAGSPQAVTREVAGGAAAIEVAVGAHPKWFRGATALYSPSSIAAIRGMGYRIAGFSVNGDGGAMLGARAAERRIAAARDGDVVIAHINQPTRAAGDGVVNGIRALKAKGVTFVRLADVVEQGSDGSAD
ncbi:polysaccharide deacetylase family protein [Rhizobiaceae bacterium n13]|uniref:Chitooligosaccharide deacetylase n=1 Tax=Ferirhizobium litorale TaxID=2927786 RepID=A0AAE3QDX4_9HYPH|nr:polysaccharide deacetylase family protein [Fererhizobium litorale]MDI7861306.1 polysaccharide deacetylase family protein [Fererhizobium litorale]MDI7921453.1 polysaccharide deacetylase family protein [Fererhizobium litorale]